MAESMYATLEREARVREAREQAARERRREAERARRAPVQGVTAGSTNFEGVTAEPGSTAAKLAHLATLQGQREQAEARRKQAAKARAKAIAAEKRRLAQDVDPRTSAEVLAGETEHQRHV